MRTIIILSLILLLTSCTVKPPVIPTSYGNEYYLSCNQLFLERQKAEVVGIDVDAEDTFKLRYLSPTNAIISSLNINKSRKAVEKRITYLNKVIYDKRCGYSQ